MDCEKFESAMLDELYGELDELTTAAAKRHVAGCARCAARIGGLRATRRVATVSLVEPPGDLEERVLLATERAGGVVAPRARVAEAISLAGSWAMKPQTAMAAVFLVMIGTSVLLLRSKSVRAPASAEVTVTEKGTPAPAAAAEDQARDQADFARMKPFLPTAPSASDSKPSATQSSVGKESPPNPSSSTESPHGGDHEENSKAPGALARPSPETAQVGQDEAQPDDLFDAALRNYRAGQFKEAARAFDAMSQDDTNAPNLWAARAVREGTGCRAAVGRFDKAAQRYKQTPPGWDALLEGALCYRSLGEFGTARARLSALLGIDSHKDRARAELDRINDAQQPSTGSEAVPPLRATRQRSAAAQTPAGGPATPNN
jgi:TolA-binding protein